MVNLIIVVELLVNGTFSNYLRNNNESSIVYAVINSQRLRLIVGTGLTDYDWYVSPTGHNGLVMEVMIIHIKL